MKRKTGLTLLLLLCVADGRTQVYFNIEQDFPCNSCGTNYHPTANLSNLKKYNYNEIKPIFDSLSRNCGIEFNYPQGGCQQRAQIMSMLLTKKFRIQHARVWLFAPVDLDRNDNRTLTLADRNGLSPGNTIQWGYHVAPVVLVKRDNGIDTLVIDPSIKRDQPITLSDWLNSIGNSNVSKYTFLQSDLYFFNVQCCDANNNLLPVINGYFYDFSNPAKDNLTMEKGLAINDMAIAIYNKYIVPLQSSSSAADINKLNDLKSIFGNATVLDYLFSQNISAKTDRTSHRYVMANYGDIMVDARDIFNKRLLFWTKTTTQLLVMQ